jgi:hypothetical protein
MNHPEEAEEYCLTVYDPDVDYSFAFFELLDAAQNEGNPARDWHGIRHVRLRGSNIECPLYTPLITGFEIRFIVADDISPPCGSSAIGCRIPGPEDPDEFSGHEEDRYATIYLKGDTFGDAWWPFGGDGHLISHEIGHALGLCDGGPGAPSNPLCEAWDWHGDCRDSVMHTYSGLPPWDWCFPPERPTHNDIETVEELVPMLGSGQGGSSAGCGGKAFCG